MITAEEARELMKSTAVMEGIETEIKNAAFKGHSEILIGQNEINNIVLKHLESLGYTIKPHKQFAHDFHGEEYTVNKYIIRWE